ncbi:ATPase [Deinococcus koreensis]|uniref:ATPase n=1 Tax=Deinococcus koreensis TaxID=2054903 RepID=A0A2K3V243_9DEIO|nr:ATPase [Deinococcus koreensis]PNY82835.1 ATPase [Deinococcus koreensis]
MPSPQLPFLRADPAPPATFEARLGELSLTVLVGVTGVGKSTALAALSGERLRVLPDRRRIADAVMILPLAGQSVTDREERFRLTALYRQTHPGGMAQALGSLVADTRHWGQRPVFDGLRGEAEVRYAVQHFPAWRFVALGAPDLVRVRRLLGRADAFDRVRGAAPETDLRAALQALPGVGAVFSRAQLDELAGLAGAHSPAEVLAKVRIVVSERRQYDPAAAEALLRPLGRGRALLLDTVELSPAQVAQALRDWA